MRGEHWGAVSARRPDVAEVAEAIHEGDRLRRFRELLAEEHDWNRAVRRLKRELSAEADSESGAKPATREGAGS